MQPNNILNHRFQLQEIIGSGGMGVVYRGIDGHNGQTVAIKMLNYDMAVMPEAKKALEREAQKEQNCKHPNLIETYGYYQDKEMGYKVMEYLEGTSLKRMMQNFALYDAKKKKRQQKEVVALTLQVLQGLIEMHKKGLVHSDLKPSNIMILKSGLVKIFDFGIVRTLLNPALTAAGENSLFDPTRFVAFTPVYASYEMLSGHAPSPSDDLYALGCIVYEWLTGTHPYKRLSAKEALEQGVECKKPATLNAQIWAALKPALALKQSERYTSGEAFLNALSKKRPWYNIFVKR